MARTRGGFGWFRLASLAGVLTISPPRPGWAQAASHRDSSPELRGTVVDGDGHALPGARVQLLGVADLQADSGGAFRVTGLAPGTYLLRTGRLGFEPSLKAVTVAAGVRLDVTVTLLASGQQLAPIVTRADSVRLALADPTGFLWRARTGQGHYVTQADIARERPIRTEEVFRTLPGVGVDTAGIIRIDRGRIRVLQLQSGDRVTQWNSCIGVQVFVDGAMMAQPFDVNLIPPGRIRGIEVYPGPATTPAALRSAKSVCGTVAIWTQ